MTGRLRNFFSRERRIAVLKADRATAEGALFEMARRYREEVDELATELSAERRHSDELTASAAELVKQQRELRTERHDLAVEVAQLRKERDAVHCAVMATGRFDAGVDLVVAVQAIDAERREARAKVSDLETARRLSDVEAYKLIESNRLLEARADRSDSAEVAALKEANLKLSDQLAELRRAHERLEREAAPYGVIA